MPSFASPTMPTSSRVALRSLLFLLPLLAVAEEDEEKLLAARRGVEPAAQAAALDASRAAATEAKNACRLLAGPAAAGAQLSLVLVVLAALLLRRARERPRRDARVFAFDVLKQFASSGAAHLSGLFFSIAAAAAAAGRGSSSSSSSSSPERRQRQPSECGWYLVLFSVDTVVGSALAILLHRGAVAAAARWLDEGAKGSERAARRAPPPPPASASTASSLALPKPEEPPSRAPFAAALARCGDYGGPPARLDLFLPQLAEWTCAVVAARLLCGFSVLTFRQPLSAVAAGVDDLFSSARPSHELFSVMLVGPLLMNAAQALVQDGVLRAKKKKRAAGGATATAAEGEANDGGGGEGAELLPSPPASSSASPFSHHP